MRSIRQYTLPWDNIEGALYCYIEGKEATYSEIDDLWYWRDWDEPLSEHCQSFATKEELELVMYKHLDTFCNTIRDRYTRIPPATKLELHKLYNHTVLPDYVNINKCVRVWTNEIITMQDTPTYAVYGFSSKYCILVTKDWAKVYLCVLGIIEGFLTCIGTSDAPLDGTYENKLYGTMAYKYHPM